MPSSTPQIRRCEPPSNEDSPRTILGDLLLVSSDDPKGTVSLSTKNTKPRDPRNRPREAMGRNTGPTGGQDLPPLRYLPYLTVSEGGLSPRGPKILTCVAGFLRDTSPQHRALASKILQNTSVDLLRFAVEWRI